MLKSLLQGKAGATALGLFIAFVVYLVPDARPLACGAAFTLPFLGNV